MRPFDMLPKGAFKEALRSQQPELADDLASDYLAADEAGRLDMDAFFNDDGPRRMHEAELKADCGVPTSADLRRWDEASSS